MLVHRGSGSSAGGLPACVLGSVGGAGIVRPLPADGCVCVCHGHGARHLDVLRLVHPLQSHIHAADHRGHVSNDVRLMEGSAVKDETSRQMLTS